MYIKVNVLNFLMRFKSYKLDINFKNRKNGQFFCKDSKG